ncbi:hypothetical protein SAMN05216480_10628 [Pustulibacterium marinum]|uniref:Uncharacterized protein n=1 Tax=Pustulibacterium marinum TaxID=1224947 RepID=A0A1I7GVX3_9FLAO|nr:hypothetical protein [Pustulibacterium marinum]SFU52580.1 hypothetical protein SAMN05216480_10628 [Pustulibacterium marinum]
MKYSNIGKILKKIAFIPIIVGLLFFIEIFLPYKEIQNHVVSKNVKTRGRFDNTTYTINFKEINDQFTEEIYNILQPGDQVLLYTTYFNKQIEEIYIDKDKTLYKNDTGENYAMLLFAIVFILSGVIALNKRNLRKKQIFLISFMTLLSIIMGLKIIL